MKRSGRPRYIAPVGSVLTQPEIEVLRALARGLCNKSVARELVLPLHTVERYRERIMQRTGCDGPVQLGVYAERNGLLEPSVNSETARTVDSVYSNGHARADAVAREAMEAGL